MVTYTTAWTNEKALVNAIGLANGTAWANVTTFIIGAAVVSIIIGYCQSAVQATRYSDTDCAGMCTYMYAYMFAHIYTYMYAYMYTYMYAYMYTHMYPYTYASTMSHVARQLDIWTGAAPAPRERSFPSHVQLSVATVSPSTAPHATPAPPPFVRALVAAPSPRRPPHWWLLPPPLPPPPLRRCRPSLLRRQQQ